MKLNKVSERGYYAKHEVTVRRCDSECRDRFEELRYRIIEALIRAGYRTIEIRDPARFEDKNTIVIVDLIGDWFDDDSEAGIKIAIFTTSRKSLNKTSSLVKRVVERETRRWYDADS